jgi:hypothetical protein
MSLFGIVNTTAKTAAANKRLSFAGNKLSRTQPAIHLAAALSDVVQDFDVPDIGTTYILTAHDPITHTPIITPGGPTGKGTMLRLASGSDGASKNSIVFTDTGLSVSGQVVADFDFRLTQKTGRADGFGFTLLNTAHYPSTGPVEPQTSEEPGFTGSLGIGFDIYRSTDPSVEINNNHISVHFENFEAITTVNVSPILDLAGGQWIHAQVIVQPDTGFFDLTVKLTQCGRPTGVVIEERFNVPGFAPYNSRVHLASRAFGLHADYDFDNIRVQSLDPTDNILNFDTGCYSVTETDEEVLLTVTRTGSVERTVSVNYATMAHTAMAGSDFTTLSGTLTFNEGEVTKTISIPILDDSENEGDEHFLVMLSDPAGKAALGGPVFANVRIVDDEQARNEGSWGEVIPTEVIPIQTILLPTGKVMYWDRSSNTQAWDPQPRLWDPIAELISTPEPTTYEPFCSGHSLLADGRVFVTGGHYITDTIGEDQVSIYDPFNDKWEPLPKMNAGRWYPSNVTLANGDVLVMAGTTFTNTGVFTPDGLNKLPQVWNIEASQWISLTTAMHTGVPAYSNYYPYLFVAPNGEVFNAGPQQMARYLDTSGTGTWTDVALSSLIYRDYGSAVMYDEGKVLIVGGNPHDPDLDQPTIVPSASAEIINLNESNPTWQPAGDMNFGRRHHNATLLPDGQVLVTGGSQAPGFDEDDGTVLAAEMWNANSMTWTILASQTLYRGYHSTALLLPDARVLVGGGGHPHPEGGPKYNFEIYSPPYLFKGSRPSITTAPTKVNYGQTFFVETTNIISNVSWVRLSAVTHGYNQNQRINHLSFDTLPGLCGLNVTAPANANLAPPGHYMLFILNDKGVPSTAHIIQIGPSLDTDSMPPKYCSYLPVISKS